MPLLRFGLQSGLENVLVLLETVRESVSVLWPSPAGLTPVGRTDDDVCLAWPPPGQGPLTGAAG